MLKGSHALSACCAFALASPAFGQAEYVIGSDIRPRVEASRIVTDANDDATGGITQDVRFFGYRFQTDPLDPYFTQNPGFNAAAGSGLPASSQLGFSVDRHLAYWNGSGPVSFTIPPGGESLRLNFGGSNTTITGSSGPQPGFPVGNVSTSGGIHRHLNAFLQDSGGGSGNPADGIYFTNLRLFSSDPSITTSDSIYLVYNNGLGQSQFEAALDYLSSPLPGDANFDGVVNLADFNILAAHFGQTDRAWYQGDFNGDRTVSLQDFNLLASRFGQTNSGATANPVSVPEPVSPLGLFMLTLASLHRRARSSNGAFKH
jgi:hypothetical protein